MNVFVLVILIYLLYRFIGGFLIPIFRTTRQMRQQFHEMNGQPPNNGQTTNAQGPAPKDQPGSADPGSSKEKLGEYIDFEEVK
jgi:uncharacterized protein YneF (UPF0154 family)